MIQWFNRTKSTSSEKYKNINTIPGAFYQVRNQGAATVLDVNEINKFYKRCLVTAGLICVHAYGTMQILYTSRLLTEKGVHVFGRFVPTKLLYWNLPYAVYLGSMFFFGCWAYFRHGDLITRLDKKYTPIWMRIS